MVRWLQDKSVFKNENITWANTVTMTIIKKNPEVGNSSKFKKNVHSWLRECLKGRALARNFQLSSIPSTAKISKNIVSYIFITQ